MGKLEKISSTYFSLYSPSLNSDTLPFIKSHRSELRSSSFSYFYRLIQFDFPHFPQSSRFPYSQSTSINRTNHCFIVPSSSYVLSYRKIHSLLRHYFLSRTLFLCLLLFLSSPLFVFTFLILFPELKL